MDSLLLLALAIRSPPRNQNQTDSPEQSSCRSFEQSPQKLLVEPFPKMPASTIGPRRFWPPHCSSASLLPWKHPTLRRDDEPLPQVSLCRRKQKMTLFRAWLHLQWRRVSARPRTCLLTPSRCVHAFADEKPQMLCCLVCPPMLSRKRPLPQSLERNTSQPQLAFSMQPSLRLGVDFVGPIPQMGHSADRRAQRFQKSEVQKHSGRTVESAFAFSSDKARSYSKLAIRWSHDTSLALRLIERSGLSA